MNTSKDEDSKLIRALRVLLGSENVKDREPLTPEWKAELLAMTEKVLRSLTPREEKVIRMRFGIGEKSEHTLEEVAEDFEVTRERIRQIEAKALRKLRHIRSSKPRAFPEGVAAVSLEDSKKEGA